MVRWITSSGFFGLQFAPLAKIMGTTKVNNNFIIQNYPCGIKGHDRLGRPLYFKLCVCARVPCERGEARRGEARRLVGWCISS